MNEHGRNDRDILRYTDVEYTPEGYENVYRWDDFLEIAGGDARYAAMLINRTVAGEPEEGLHPETLVDQDIRDGETFMGNPAAARPLHVSPTAISQAVRYGSPVNGLHFYHGDEPKPAPEFFKPAKVKGGKSPAAIAAAAKVAAGNSAPGTDYREHGIQRNRRAVQ